MKEPNSLFFFQVFFYRNCVQDIVIDRKENEYFSGVFTKTMMLKNASSSKLEF